MTAGAEVVVSDRAERPQDTPWGWRWVALAVIPGTAIGFLGGAIASVVPTTTAVVVGMMIASLAGTWAVGIHDWWRRTRPPVKFTREERWTLRCALGDYADHVLDIASDLRQQACAKHPITADPGLIAEAEHFEAERNLAFDLMDRLAPQSDVSETEVS